VAVDDSGKAIGGVLASDVVAALDKQRTTAMSLSGEEQTSPSRQP
jgi:hypothetical protein